MHRSELINKLISQKSLHSYLEFGVEKDGSNYKSINAPFKLSFDIEYNENATFKIDSDNFFRILNQKMDFIFVDGDHNHIQVCKDIINALQHVNDNGYILCHDTCPYSEQMQIVPRQSIAWTGDVWKAILKIRKAMPVYVVTLDSDFGLTLIIPNKSMPIYERDFDDTYDNYLKYRNEFLNLVGYQEFFKILDIN
jgi:hypothetical protein